MRNNYVADIGDYYKYGLLRALNGETIADEYEKLRLGIAWYLYVDDCNPNDGLHLGYLNSEKRDRYRPCDPVLYDKLGRLIADNARNISEIRQRNILPRDTLFHEEPLSLSALPKGNAAAIRKRLEHRAWWLNGALQVTEAAQFIFFDPDNGLETKSIPKHNDRGPKFVFYNELTPFWERGQSLIIYQHKNMHETARMQIQTRLKELQDKFAPAYAEAIYFPSFTGRIFLIIAQKNHAKIISDRCQIFKRIWGDHLSVPDMQSQPSGDKKH